jgi:branched-chain amino acid transport system permease protein
MGSATFKGLVPWLVALVTMAATHFMIVPLLPSTLSEILVFAGINIVLAVSLNLVNGFTGQFSIGHAGFMAVGAYAAAWATLALRNAGVDLSEGTLMAQLILIGALVFGGLLSGAVGFLVGLPSLRLKGDYLAIVTLGFGEIIRVVLLNLDFLGGARGLSGIPRISSFLMVYLCVVVTVFVVWRVISSNH